MFRRRNQVGVCLMALGGIAVGLGLLNAQQRVGTLNPEVLLPVNAVLYVKADGALLHEEKWRETAAYDALVKSGLYDVLKEAVVDTVEQLGQRGQAGEAWKAFEHVRNNGVSFAAALANQPDGAPSPWAILVVHEAGGYDNRLSELLAGTGERELQFDVEKIGNRTVHRKMIPDTPGVEVAFWTEGPHLVLVGGMGAVDAAIAVADGDVAGIRSGTAWASYSDWGDAQATFDATSVFWFDFKAVREMFGGMPLPLPGSDPQNPKRVSDALEVLGLATLDGIVSRSGYKGRALWSESHIVTGGERRGLLKLLDQEPFTLDDLPPLPQNLTGLYATRFDCGAAWDVLTDVARDVEQFIGLGGPESQVDQFLGMADEALGISIRDDLLAALGSLSCVYGDGSQGILGFGGALTVSVEDPSRLRATLRNLLGSAQRELQREDVPFRVRSIERRGREVVLLEIAEGAFSPALCIDGEWMCIGLDAQSVDAFLLRRDGDLPTWEPSPEAEEALAAVPQEIIGLSMTDPRPAIRSLMSMAPMLVGFAEAGARASGELPPGFEWPLSASDLPPAELVVAPLFPNVTVATVDETGVHYTSRVALPAFPMFGGADGATTIATTGVLVALLLPAVQSARSAARRTQSANNLKQIALALHNHHDVYRALPRGTIENDDLEPDERLSWFVSILPFVEQQALQREIDSETGWEADANRQALMSRIDVLMNPGVSDAGDSGYAPTHYVGIAGLGEDGPTLPLRDPKAGMFGYNRATSFRDVTDGLSNTLMTSEASDDFGPWGAGGNATIRPFTTKPYINGPDGIGGPYPGGCNMGLGDGAVRFISEDIDPSVIEAMTTINGRERVDF
ncbi:hypothetical protein Mal4_31380 [Maioricimonas rarisocia]|uniref:DUF1559 domain-containing protein n=1 Tax=Maioricimonas rarisocia TaxID=2528026 RepID=A0A517Z8J6_9PLAN|nr:DUF1559 domain-containing protein [Maioricimonas rarisocia]QDU38808.1 hypothetical protein Mal4_31380 [Maioricimonas rarisocia]